MHIRRKLLININHKRKKNNKLAFTVLLSKIKLGLQIGKNKCTKMPKTFFLLKCMSAGNDNKLCDECETVGSFIWMDEYTMFHCRLLWEKGN